MTVAVDGTGRRGRPDLGQATLVGQTGVVGGARSGRPRFDGHGHPCDGHTADQDPARQGQYVLR